MLAKIKNHLPTALLILAVVVSFIYQANFRNKHFQECDSSGVYYLLHSFPQSGLNFTAIAYQNSRGIISKQQAYQILENPKLAQITAPILKKYSKDFIADKLSQSSPLATLRYAEISAVGLLHLPYTLQSTLALPLSSTYSPAAGLLYGLFTAKGSSYESFMSAILLLNLLIFHASVLLLYATAKKLKIRDWPAALVSLLALFSISLYSSGFNAGSIIWIIFSGMLWLYLLADKINNENLLKNLSIISGILIFFNYLIAFFWMGFLIGYWIFAVRPKLNPGFKSLIKSWLNLIISQKTGLLLFLLCGALFYPPGQAVRAISQISHLGKDFYYVILNFFTFYVGSKPLEITQFVLGLLLSLGGIWYVIKNFKKDLFASVLFGIFLVYLAAVLFKILGFGATRHMLFLAPPLFLSIALGLNELWKKITPKSSFSTFLGLVLFLGITITGFWSISFRHKVAVDNTAGVTIDADVNAIGVYDCSTNLVYRNWDSKAKADFINPKNFEAGQTYLYLSQTFGFDEAALEWQKKYNFNYTILNSSSKETNVFFTAYNPGWDNRLYLFTRPNNLYQTKFKINSISAK